VLSVNRAEEIKDMTGFEIFLFIVVVLIMLVGIVGVILPILPGTPLIFGAALLYAVITNFEQIDLQILIIFAVLVLIAQSLDWLAATYGVKRMGGSYFGVLGALIGMIAGILLSGLVGLIIGAFAGAVVFELMIGKKYDVALRAGLGSFIGFLVGGVVKFAIAAVMIGMFILKVLF
jgi:uncharacterized protein